MDSHAVEGWRQRRLSRTENAPQTRTEFQRDVDRIWYAGAFRRLGGVTQVVSREDGEVFHNRLTHSLKVASLSRRLAERLVLQAQKTYGGSADEYLASLGGLSPDVAEAAGLAHDLGHAPFGHHGEAVLDRLVGDEHGGFNGNAQAFRIVTRLAYQDIEPGLNLTRATLNGLVKYPWLRSDRGGHRQRWGAYPSEEALLEKLRTELPVGVTSRLELPHELPSVEASIMDWADDVTYAVHDVEDFIRAKLIPHDILKQEGASDWSDIIEHGRERILRDLPNATDNRLRDAIARIAGRSRSVLMGFAVPFNGSSRHRALLKMWASDAIGYYFGQASLVNPGPSSTRLLDVPQEIREEVLLLKELSWYFVINRPGLATIQVGQA